MPHENGQAVVKTINGIQAKKTGDLLGIGRPELRTLDWGCAKARGQKTCPSNWIAFPWSIGYSNATPSDNGSPMLLRVTKGRHTRGWSLANVAA